MKTAIAIMSFNRPHYLARVLNSIASQDGINSFDVHFFQDGCVTDIDRVRVMEESVLWQNIDLVESILPETVIKTVQAKNVGVYKHFQYAESALFENRDYERIIFCEDDLVLAPYYFRMLSKLMDDLEEYRIAEVNLCGNINLTKKQQAERENVLIPAGHHWGYGLYRDKWIERQKYMQEYNDLVYPVDYRRRPTEKILQMYKNQGSKINVSSQDGAKDVAYMRAGLGRVTTSTVHAKYIGREGLHQKKEVYDKFGYAEAELYHEHGIQLDKNNVLYAIEQSIQKVRL